MSRERPLVRNFIARLLHVKDLKSVVRVILLVNHGGGYPKYVYELFLHPGFNRVFLSQMSDVNNIGMEKFATEWQDFKTSPITVTKVEISKPTHIRKGVLIIHSSTQRYYD